MRRVAPRCDLEIRTNMARQRGWGWAGGSEGGGGGGEEAGDVHGWEDSVGGVPQQGVLGGGDGWELTREGEVE